MWYIFGLGERETRKSEGSKARNTLQFEGFRREFLQTGFNSGIIEICPDESYAFVCVAPFEF